MPAQQSSCPLATAQVPQPGHPLNHLWSFKKHAETWASHWGAPLAVNISNPTGARAAVEPSVQWGAHLANSLICKACEDSVPLGLWGKADFVSEKALLYLF